VGAGQYSLPMRRLFAFAALLPAIAFADKPITITFFDTNDLHAHVKPTLIRGKSYGGYARIATIVREARAKDPNVLLLNAGDTFQGTLFFNTYEGLADGAILSAIGMNAGTVGNHEFDRGPEVLATYASAIGWPMAAANLDLTRETSLRGKIAKYVILKVGGQKVGIVGAVTPDAPNISSPGPNIDFRDVVPTVQASVDELTAAGVNKIVVVTHCGYEEDQKMVSQLRNVDLVVGGHSHTPLGTPEIAGWMKSQGPFPTIVKDLKDDDLNTLSQHFEKLPAKRSDEPVDPALAKHGAEIAATRRCGSCHLPSLAGQEQMPRLARQRVDYLIATLKSYRDSPRPGADTAMSAAIAGASDADIVALAHYAASL